MGSSDLIHGRLERLEILEIELSLIEHQSTSAIEMLFDDHSLDGVIVSAALDGFSARSPTLEGNECPDLLDECDHAV